MLTESRMQCLTWKYHKIVPDGVEAVWSVGAGQVTKGLHVQDSVARLVHG